MEGKDKFLVDEEFLETEHGRYGCITCHGGVDTLDMEEAHEGLTARPSGDMEDGTCVECHDNIADTYEDAIHYTVQGMYNSLENFSYPGALEEEGHPLREAFDEDCSKCHATCGSCHVSRPKTYEGGLHSQHEFTREPPEDETCFGCHGARVAGEFTGEVGYTADVHYEEHDMSCYDCHPVSNFHGTGEEEQWRFEVETLPECQDCHGDVYSEDSPIEAHRVHEEDQMACQVCHSSEAQSCYDCHITVEDDGTLTSSSTSRLLFKIGQNPEPTEEVPYDYIPLRHVPTTKDTFVELNGELPRFDEISNWKYSPIHNVQRETTQNQTCNACHGNQDIFLQEEDIWASDSEASRDLIVEEVPELKEDREIVEEEFDEEEVLREAAEDYFTHIDEGHNNLTPPQEVKNMVDTDPDALFILDLRSEDDFEEGHIPGAVNSSPGGVGQVMDRIPRDQPVVVTCYSGQNAGYVIAALRMSGFENVTSLQGGINNGWRGADLELESTGMKDAKDLDSVSSPHNEAEEIIWDQAQRYFEEVQAGRIGFLDGEDQVRMHQELQEDPNAYYVVDIRAAEDYEEGHITGAKHVPWGQFNQAIDDLPVDVPIAIGCYSGQTAGQTLGVLRMLGFDNANSILSGVDGGWIGQQELPVETSD